MFFLAASLVVKLKESFIFNVSRVMGVLCHCSVILNAIQYFSEAMHEHFGAGKGFAKQVSHTANPLMNFFEEN